MGGRCFHLAVVLATGAMVSVHAAVSRPGDVFYLDEWKQPPFQLRALGRAPMTVSPNESRDVAYLAKGQPVTVIGLGETTDYVEVQTATGPACGWVNAAALEPPPAGLLDSLRKRGEQAAANRELIARREVALGMTPAEVRESLGEPGRKLHAPSRDGRLDLWVYDTYRYVPKYRSETDENGRMRRVVSYTRTVGGRKVVTFRGNEVVAISSPDGTGPGLPPAATQPAPPAGN